MLISMIFWPLITAQCSQYKFEALWPFQRIRWNWNHTDTASVFESSRFGQV